MENNEQLIFGVGHTDEAVTLHLGEPIGMLLTLPPKMAAQMAKALYEHAYAVHRAQQAAVGGQAVDTQADPNPPAHTPEDPLPPTQ